VSGWRCSKGSKTYPIYLVSPQGFDFVAAIWNLVGSREYTLPWFDYQYHTTFSCSALGCQIIILFFKFHCDSKNKIMESRRGGGRVIS
jgi:hypothetical protein